MPSVRVRRGSSYASLNGDDNAEQLRSSATTRPRSRTLASIYRPSDPLASEPSPADESRAPRPGFLDAERAFSTFNPSKVADSILSAPHASQPLKRYKSNDLLYGESRRGSSGSGGQNDRPGTVTLEGSQADVVVPNVGHPGLLESRLSFTSDGSNAFQGSNEDALHHEDDIIPKLPLSRILQTAANSILIPPIGVYSRKPVVTEEDAEKSPQTHEDDLDRHVEQVLSKRARIRRTLQGVWSFVKTLFWGAAIVLFLLKWINFHNSNTQGFWIEVSSQVVNALFTVTGVGLLPWRVVDTYRILRIWHYKRLTRKLRRKAKLPMLFDEDDLPDPMYDPNYVHVLSEKQEHTLHRLQQQFMKSQTWYRPHGTPTHRVIPLVRHVLTMPLINFQCCSLSSSVSRGFLLYRFQRPPWSTGILIPLSFLCGIVSAVFIWRGGQKTRRTKEVEEKLRMALALEHHPDMFSVVEARAASRSPERKPSVRNAISRSKSKQSQDARVAEASEESSANTPVDDRNRRISTSSVWIEEKMNVPPRVIQ
ncbi:hypothetical protein DFH11DRAFT_1600871 [Phellopilus nigrolimitatus]|nr:hypothetical protein DFH11DRAFT_1600871 [Phellopilus nigrolimitatus]